LSTRYHLCLDTGVVGPERAAEIIELVVRARQAPRTS
jgi:hypothetical protein